MTKKAQYILEKIALSPELLDRAATKARNIFMSQPSVENALNPKIMTKGRQSIVFRTAATQQRLNRLVETAKNSLFKNRMN